MADDVNWRAWVAAVEGSGPLDLASEITAQQAWRRPCFSDETDLEDLKSEDEDAFYLSDFVVSSEWPFRAMKCNREDEADVAPRGCFDGSESFFKEYVDQWRIGTVGDGADGASTPAPSRSVAKVTESMPISPAPMPPAPPMEEWCEATARRGTPTPRGTPAPALGGTPAAATAPRSANSRVIEPATVTDARVAVAAAPSSSAQAEPGEPAARAPASPTATTTARPLGGAAAPATSCGGAADESDAVSSASASSGSSTQPVAERERSAPHGSRRRRRRGGGGASDSPAAGERRGRMTSDENALVRRLAEEFEARGSAAVLAYSAAVTRRCGAAGS